MSTRLPLIAAIAAALAGAGACSDAALRGPGDLQDAGDDDWADDDVAGDDDGSACEISGTDPVDGAPSAYYRAPVVVYFDASVSAAGIEVVGPDGPIDGATALSDDGLTAVFDPFGDDPDRHLEPLTAYEASVDGPGCTATWTFSTSDLGMPLDEDVDLGHGLVYAVDLDGATLEHPAGADSLLAPLAPPAFALSVDGDGDTDLRLLAGGLDHETMDQDLCQLTVDLTGQMPATLTGSHLSLAKAGGVVLPVVASTGLPLLSLDIEAEFVSDATELREGHLDAIIDAYELDRVLREVSGDADAYPAGTTCALLEQLGAPCQGCPGNPQQVSCVTFSYGDLDGQWIDDGVLVDVAEPTDCR